MTPRGALSWRVRTANAVLLVLQLLLWVGVPFAEAHHHGTRSDAAAHLHADGSAECPPGHGDDCALCRFSHAPVLVSTVPASIVAAPQASGACPSPTFASVRSLPASSPLGPRAPPLV